MLHLQKKNRGHNKKHNIFRIMKNKSYLINSIGI
jgi:hypothetical protein